MEENSEETIELNRTVLNTSQNNQIEKYFNLENNIKTIDRMGRHGNVVLHVASCHGYNESIQLFLTNSALESLKNNSSQSILYDESKMDEREKLFLKNSNLHRSQEKILESDYMEWSSNGNDLKSKSREFRVQIDLYKTYDNQHNSITNLLIEIIEYYLNEYIVKQEDFLEEDRKKIEKSFKQAIEEQNYLKYFIEAYTSTNNFHCILNRHLAFYILDYFNTSSYSTRRTKYRLINCLVHIVTLLIHHPDINSYQYKGTTYRGLLMTENDLKRYSIGKYILNRSFVSTSKDRVVAEMYAANSEQNLDHHGLPKVSVLLKFIIKQNQTAINIEEISTIRDEKEVLILPFSVFQIKDRIENSSNMHSQALAEIDLVECEDDEQENKPLTNPQHRTKKWKNLVRSKWLYITIGLFIISSLILVTVLINRQRDPKWKQIGITVAGGNGEGHDLDQFSYPLGISIDDDQTIYIADSNNHRIVEWKLNAINGQIVADKTNQLNSPADVVIDKENNSLIISDGKRQIIRWSRQNNTNGQIIISDIDCYMLTMDRNGSLYVSDTEKHEVRRWKKGEKVGTLVAGGNGKGDRLDQLNFPSHMFVDDDFSLYVCDSDNHRVMKWVKGAKEGIVVAGGNGEGSSLTQLGFPHGVIVDRLGRIYVADMNNNRVVRWDKYDKGTIIVGGNGRGEKANQFDAPSGLSFDRQENLYVVDRNNNRVQKFEIY